MPLEKLKRLKLTFVLILIIVNPAYAASIKDVNQLNLEDYHGKVVYLDFWASWCKPCQKSFPWMNSIQQRYGENNFRVVTINLDSEQAAMDEFLTRIPANFEVFHDPSGTLAEKFDLKGMPTSYLINKLGKVIKRHIGFQTNSIPEYEREIENLL